MKDIKITESEKSISLKEFNSFLNEFNLKLPDTYKDFILKHNGGYPKLSAYGNPYEDGFEVDVFLCIDMTYNRTNISGDVILPSVNDTIDTHQVLENNIPKYLFSFGLDAGGNDFCISMREEDFGAIYAFYMDGTSEEPIFICDSFEEFINGLEDIEKYEED
ncbi:SMI1/KNR4 family protein [Tenacibaculum caenipelagi]|uniref:SMI1/KNR4 family protein SUKH-1 n=1 Tax=Tenacibaculum caenipelagi TaxID=1325435 RepID=A0A4R6TK46_9FLAO|nr:SMI1/KNR4 family protein [Tenacibaculum caenipelagi]TDQ28611.1 SMI1/KNR4 family protein SUKH-1 [Tenacibaculum caenipelagi]